LIYFSDYVASDVAGSDDCPVIRDVCYMEQVYGDVTSSYIV